MQRHAAFDRQMSGRGKTVAHELAEILRRVMRMYVADHRRSLGMFVQRWLNATPSVVTVYFARRLGRKRGGTDAGSSTYARNCRVKAAKCASWPCRSA